MERCPFCLSPVANGDQSRRITFTCGTFRFVDREGPRRSDRCVVGELRSALDESVKLQSHYAELLNGYDGGSRIQFTTAAHWMDRLRELKSKRLATRPPGPPEVPGRDRPMFGPRWSN